MRNPLHHAGRGVLLLAVALLAACASSGSTNTADTTAGGAPAQAAEGSLSLRIINTHSSGETLTIYLEPEAGQRRTLGRVAAAATLNVPFTDPRGRYRLVAERELGERINSPSFNAQMPGIYVWDLSLNNVRRVDR